MLEDEDVMPKKKQLRIVTHRTKEEDIDHSQESTPRLDPMQEHKQSSLTHSVDPDQVSRKIKRTQLLCQENPMSRLRVKESDIPLDVLYNKELNAMKLNERQYDMQERPVAFSVWKDYEGESGHHIARFHVCQ